MVGYQIDENGRPMLKRPIWRPLTHRSFQAAKGNDLLCRTVRYENRDLGIHDSPSMKMPVYNKYFIISGGSASTGPLRRGRRMYRDRLSKRINRILKQHRFLRGEYLSTAVVSSRRIMPTAATKRRVTKNLDMSQDIKVKNKLR